MNNSHLPPYQKANSSHEGVRRNARSQSNSRDGRSRLGASGPQYTLTDTGVMPVMIGPAINESRRQQLYGSSSAGSFIQHVRKVVEQKTSSPTAANSSASTRDQNNLPLMYPHEDVDQPHSDYSLPTRARADVLMAVYWSYVHTLYPIIGKRMTTADYESLWRGDGLIPHERSFLCLLNIMLALTSQLSPSTKPHERAASAAVFYGRARDLLDLERTASVRYVQIYLHFGLYLQSTNEPHQCWNFVALAIRTAQSLELHLPETIERPSDARHRALLRRAWHGCVLMDRVLAMTYGRPCMIDRRVALSVPHPLPVEGEEISADPSMSVCLDPTERPTLLDFFNQSLTLYDIMHDILVNFYSPEVSHIQSLDDVYQHYFEGYNNPMRELGVLEIDRRLSRWEKAVPSYLKLCNYSQGPGTVTVLSRQAVVLYQRFLHVRLQALRPVLSAFISFDSYEKESHPSLDTFLSRSVIFQCSVVCVRVAQEAIGLVHKRRTEDPGAVADLAEWWYNVLYLYSSATVLIAARLSPFILAEISEAAIFDSWQQAMQALDRYSIFGSSIKRLITTLRLLFDTVPQQFSRLRPLPEDNIAQQQRNGFSTVVQASTQEALDGRLGMISRPSSPSSVDKNMAETNAIGFDLDDPGALFAAFDTNDMSWLTTAPFEM
ncbi:Fungal specific transcription factor domain-containing protein [Cladophialophora immunda]|nr:Fungal specific transcription factor domain-containing protein [Cladophialophora immunda]